MTTEETLKSLEISVATMQVKATILAGLLSSGKYIVDGQEPNGTKKGWLPFLVHRPDVICPEAINEMNRLYTIIANQTIK